MPTEFTIRPTRLGDVIRDPVSMKPLKAEGERKPRTLYWQRRLATGDVALVSDAGTVPASKATKTAQVAQVAQSGKE